ncbi:MAG: gamma-glutamyltransferase [Candidatus Nanopelagicales bacterium]|nr:gamma-glutamyltransferase [Candidatus Nanopelagicales bacterium]
MVVDPVRSAVARGGPGSAAVAAGSWATARAGAEVLAAGGNAVDAVLAACFASTVAEFGVASLGGGGFLVVRTPDGTVHLRDAFVDTPGRGLPAHALDLHFLPMDVHYPSTIQTFHVGMGSVAVPGLLAGILAAHDEFARLPLATLVAPAQRYGREGVPIEPAQALILDLVRELVALSPESRALVERDGRWLGSGDLARNPELADFLDLVADGSVSSIESAAFARPLLGAMAQGGLVTAADLDAFRVLTRAPATAHRAGYTLFTNPPPSFGGSIIADTLAAATPVDPADARTWLALVDTLTEATVRRRTTATVPLTATGTTHASAVDADGMIAAMTTSNGVTSGFVIPGTGIQLNNMLGEADLNPDGFHATPPGQRLGSMMSPSILVAPDGGVTAMGTGGSERIRSSMVEVMVRLVDAGQPLAEAVSGARVHPDDRGLQVEPHLGAGVIAGLAEGSAAPVNVWPEHNLFFGGVNAVQRTPDGTVTAVADGRRGGGALVVVPS